MTMTAIATRGRTPISPITAWLNDLTPKAQGYVAELVNEGGFPLDDVYTFTEDYGVDALLSGYYEEWCRLDNVCGHTQSAIEAFVDEFGIHEIGSFEDAYVGEYDSEEAFAEEYYADHRGTHIPAGIVVDWQATFEGGLSDDYSYVNGYVFSRNY